MPIVHLQGKVLPYKPEAFTIAIKDLPTVTWSDGQSPDPWDITTRINDSMVDVEFEVAKFDDTQAELELMLIRAWDFARAAVDLLAFQLGWGLSVVLDTLVKPDGQTSTILAKNEPLAPYSTAVHASQSGVNNFDLCYRLLISEPALFMAMNDLIVSITLPHNASINCARVIEGLRARMAPVGTDRKQAWLLMQQNLNLAAAYVTYVTDVSTGPRHGDRTWIPGTTVNEIVKRTWIVMNRFLEFRKRGNQSLPVAEFPLLKN